jgi:Uma2 family endonuclease
MSDMLLAMEPRKITVAEYHRMAAEGILGDDERIELLDGLLISMSPIGRAHWALHLQIDAYLKIALAGRAAIGGQTSLALGDFNEPQPDIAVLAPNVSEYFTRPVGCHEIYALIEIADASLAKDTGPKRDLYARFAIADYLVADVQNVSLIQHSQPVDGRYARLQRLGYGDAFSLATFPSVVLDVDPFLPPRA